MRNYLFTVKNGIGPAEQYEMNLADLQAARIEAARFFGAMIANEPEDFWKAMDWQLSVHDLNGLLLFELRTVAMEAPVAQQEPGS